MGRVEYVDVDGEVHRAVAEAGEHPFNGNGEPLGLELMAGDDGEAQAFVVAEVVAGVERTADAHMEAGLHVDEAFLRGAAERGAVGNWGAEVGVPRVEVCVEVKHRDRPVVFGNDAKQGRAIVWSPPMVISRLPSADSAAAVSWICVMASVMSNGSTF